MNAAKAHLCEVIYIELDLLLLRHTEWGAHYDTRIMIEAELCGLSLHIKRLDR